jgi:hypothetical protein
MFMPMLGLLTVLIVVGGLATLVAVGDPGHARIAPYLGFVFLFAGLGALVLCLGLALIGELLHSESLTGIGFFAGYAIGGLAGAVFGLTKAVKRRRLQLSHDDEA